MNDLPQELLDELGGQLKDDRKYTAHDHVLAKINETPDGATANDLLIYLYYAQGEKVTKREYLYHVLSRLRKAGFIESVDASVPNKARSIITPAGADVARPMVEVPHG